MHVVRAQVLLPLKEVAQSVGADFNAILRSLDLRLEDLKSDAVYIRAQTLDDLFERLAIEWDMLDIGLRVAEATDISVMGPVALALVHAQTGRDSLAIAQRSMASINSHWRLLVETIKKSKATFVELVSAYPLKRPSAQVAERAVLTTLRFVQLTVESKSPPLEVRFKHPPISPMSVYRTAFGVTPIFNQTGKGLVFDDAMIDRANPRANETLARLAETYIKRLKPVPANDFVAQVRAVCEHGLAVGLCTHDRVAAQMGMHVRTLQRRLREHDTTFDEIRDDARRIVAGRLLQRLDLGLGDIAEMLGYADQRAFNRRCHHWFGAAPSEIRQRSSTARVVS